jgi:hypothetical protein
MIGKACIGVTILYKLQRDCALLWQSRKKDFSPHSSLTTQWASSIDYESPSGAYRPTPRQNEDCCSRLISSC